MAFKYRGILAEEAPIDLPPGRLLGTEESFAEWVRRKVDRNGALMRALYEAHGVPWGDEKSLLQRLAEAHVPGFRERKRSGRPMVWNPRAKATLRMAIDDYIAERAQEGKRVSVSQACASFAERELWKGMLRRRHGKPAEALRGHYNTADRAFAQVIRDAIAHMSLPTDQGGKGMAPDEIARLVLGGFSRSE